MSSRPDIIAWMLACVAKHAPAVDQATLQAIEVEARRQWGGQRIDYVPKSVGRSGTARIPAELAQAVRADAMANTPTAVILERHGISRASLYRLVKTDAAD